MLYNPERHETLSSSRWDEGLARTTIAEIVGDTEAHFDRECFWPVHGREDARGILKCLWFGAAGVIWALRHLAESGAAETQIDLADAIDRVRAKFRAEEDPRTYSGSFLMGEVGFLLVYWRVTRERGAADQLFKLITDNAEQPTDELMWGAPGTALASSFMWEWTNEERWRSVLLRKIEELWSRWKYRPEHNCFFWRQRLYSPEARIFLGPVHGFSGNACVLMRAASMMAEERREEMYDRIARAIRATAQVEGVQANWLGLVDSPAPDAVRPWLVDGVGWLVQWCHGAPGTLGALSAFPKDRDGEMDSLFAAGGELTFAAGPLTKGPNLCHGTGGNGILFLKLYQRTGDTKWLHRARAFAMHGIEQYQRLKTEYDQGWYSLWTGDLGFAVYLWQCITKESGFPSMDFF
ncbi:MAG: lanthionine synthetase C family protein [Candidatus Binataceae bacterium]